MTTHIIAQPNSIHILWQVPQYIIITAGEVSHSIFISKISVETKVN